MGKGRDLSGRCKDGTQVPVEIGLAPIETEDGSCVLSSIVDISERRLAEEKLRESEERFRAIFFQAAVGMSETTVDGHWLLLNDRLCEILGYSRDEVVGKKFYDFTHPDDREASLAAVRQLLAGEISSSLIEKRYIQRRRPGLGQGIHVVGTTQRSAIFSPCGGGRHRENTSGA